ncbi:MAG: NUDIX hydrolase [Candidatus Pacebacteria bacterium]|nr:NUDIX hydrolase [Candidatus Paceibacterota bacterium]
MEKIQQVSIKGLLCRDNKVLLLKTPTGRWELPGGRMNFGENVEQTLKREIKEEIGFKDVKMGNLANTWSFISKEIIHHFIVFVFEFFTEESKIKLSVEHVEYKWISVSNFEEIDMSEGHKESLRKYFKLL